MIQLPPVLPHDLAAERDTLGAALIDREAAAVAVEALTASDFYTGPHKTIFRTLAELHGAGEDVDQSTLRARLADRGELENVGGVGYLADLAASVATSANVGSYARRVRAFARLRGLQAAGAELQRAAGEPGADPDALAERFGANLAAVKTGPQADRLVTVNAATIEPEAVTWLWPNRYPAGKLTILAGDPGLGKSRAGYDAAARVTTGEPWPDGAAGGEPGRVVILNAEDGAADTIVPTLTASGADLAAVEIVEAVRKSGRACPFLLSEDLPDLDRRISTLGRVRMLIIDPISAYLGATDDHRNAELRGLLAPLATLAERHRLAVLAVHHLSKAPNFKAIYKVTGSIAYAGAARAVWLISEDAENPERRLFLCAKMSLCRKPAGLGFTINDQGAVAWESGPVTMTADEAMTDAGGRHSRTAEALDWLADFLAAGEKPKTEVVKAAADHDPPFSPDVLRRASERLGVQSYPGERGPGQWTAPWVWRLPRA